MPSSSKPVRQARARVMVRPAFRERAARGVALQPPRLQIADDDPFAAEIDAPEQSAAGIQGAAPRHAVERLVRFRIGPGPLDKYAGGDRAPPANHRREPQAPLPPPTPPTALLPPPSHAT